MFSDMSILANDSFAEYVNKEHQGFGEEDFEKLIDSFNFDIPQACIILNRCF